MQEEIKTVAIWGVLVLLWPLCAVVWLLEWPLVRLFARSAGRTPSGPVDPSLNPLI